VNSTVSAIPALKSQGKIIRRAATKQNFLTTLIDF
jgi:hypothetical protein